MAERRPPRPGAARRTAAPRPPDPARAKTHDNGAPGVAARVRAATIVHAVLVERRSLTAALVTTLGTTGSPADGRDGALVQELAYGVLRLLPRLEALVARLLHRPLRPGDAILHALLLVGIYQLIATRIPPHAAVAATVAGAAALGRPWAASLLNAALRRLSRERDALLTAVDADPTARWLLPAWLLQRLQQAWPEDWQAIIEAGNGRAPMTLRVNRLRGAPADYADRLAAAGLAATALPGQPQALRLAQPVPASALPGFAEGLVAVQDAGAQWAAALLDPQPGERVLDACAAPGNKAAHLVEHAGGALALTAVDSDPERVATLTATLQRLGHTAALVTADAVTVAADWPGAPWQRILLDVPCSATGVLRRHPDIKYLRRADDLPALVATQAALLDALWPWLTPGGRLLYATCSLLPEENEGQVQSFLARRPDARALPPAPLPDWTGATGRPRGPGWQLRPTDGGHDGFFYALLEKVPA